MLSRIKQIFLTFIIFSAAQVTYAAAVGNLVWYDVNNNGIQEVSEPGIPSIRLILYNSDTNYPIDTTFSDASGSYLFSGLPAGNYYIVATGMAYGYIFTTPNLGADDSKDNDACPMGRCTLFSLTAGQTSLDYDFGLVVDNSPCALSEVLCAEAYPLVNNFCFNSYLGPEDSIASIVTQLGVGSINGMACIDYTQAIGQLPSVVDTVNVNICNNFGQCHQVCLYISQDCIIIEPPVLPCNDTLFTCLAVYPSSMTLCIPSCLFESGDEVVSGSSSFHCSIVIESDSCVTYTSFPGMPLGYIDTVRLTFQNAVGHVHYIMYYIQVGCFNDEEHAPQWLDTLMNTPSVVYYINSVVNTCVDYSVFAFDPDSAEVLHYNVVPPKHGVASLYNNNSQLWYCPNFNFEGKDTLYLEVCDELTPVECDQLMVIVDIPITNTPPPPICIDTSLACSQPFPGKVILCMNPCVFNVGDTIKTASTTFNCSLDFLSDTCIRYTPLPGMDIGITDTVRIILCNTLGDCHQITYFVNIGCEVTALSDNQPFWLNSSTNLPQTFFSVTTQENNCVIIPTIATDEDLPFDQLTYSVSAPAHGNVQWNSEAMTGVTYCPNPNFYGQDTIWISVCDTLQNNDCSTIPIVIQVAENCKHEYTLCAPMFPGQLVICPEFCQINSASIIYYQYEYPCDISLSSSQCFIIKQYPSVSNIENTIQFVGCDNAGLCDTVYYHLQVTDTNICVNQVIAIDDTSFISINDTAFINVLDNDMAYNSQVFLLMSDLPQHGVVSVVDNEILYIPFNGYFGIDCFSYINCDNNNNCDTALVCVLVSNGSGSAIPIALSDYFTIMQNGVDTFEVLINDLNLQFDYTFQIIQNTNNGIVTITNEQVIYEPNIGFSGIDTLVYQVCNFDIYCDTALVLIQVLPPSNTSPQFYNNGIAIDTFQIQAYQNAVLPFCIDVADNQSILQYTLLNANDANIAYTIDSAMVCLQYNWDNSAQTYDYFNIVVCDSLFACDTLLVLVEIFNPTDLFDLQNDFIAIYDTANLQYNITTNDAIHSTNIIYSFTVQPLHGSAVWIGNTIQYQSNMTNNIAYDSLQYIVCDTVWNICDTAWVVFENKNYQWDCFISQALSPNNDNINDYFYIDCLSEIWANKLKIFNRWGNIVYSVDMYNNQWNGHLFNEKVKLPDGTYYYLFQIKRNEKSDWEYKNGFVVLRW